MKLDCKTSTYAYCELILKLIIATYIHMYIVHREQAYQLTLQQMNLFFYRSKHFFYIARDEEKRD